MAEANMQAATANAANSNKLSWGPNDQHRLINTRLPRVDFPFKTTGTAVYSYDVKLPGMLHGRILTSPHASTASPSSISPPPRKSPA